MKNLQGKGLMKINGQEVFLQPLGNQSKLIICGGGHVSQALVKMAGLLDFEITVLEDRPLFAETAKREGADQVFCGDYRELLQQIPDSSDNYFVCMTRGHRFDRDCLLEILKKAACLCGHDGFQKTVVSDEKGFGAGRFFRRTGRIAPCTHRIVHRSTDSGRDCIVCDQ